MRILLCFLVLGSLLRCGHGTSTLQRKTQLHACEPSSVEPEERCNYLKQHPACSATDSLINYLEIHYCYLHGSLVLSALLFTVWIALLFIVLMVVAERFFCPALELISEYLKLSPCVAGATLLSFGNGAPDVFTQLAAVTAGDQDVSQDGVLMALSEPLGSGLFVSNIVFAFVILAACKTQEVRVQRKYFMKDVLFCLGAVAIVFLSLFLNTIYLWQCILLALYYVTYVVSTIWVSKGDEPVHINPILHEIPHQPWPDLYNDDSIDVSSLRSIVNAHHGAWPAADASSPSLTSPREVNDTLTSHYVPGTKDTEMGATFLSSAHLHCTLANLPEEEPLIEAEELAPRHERVWRVVEMPILALLSISMPRVDNPKYAIYRRQYAIAAPLVVLLLVCYTKGWLKDTGEHWQPFTATALCCTTASVLIALLYPRKGKLRGLLKGFGTVLAFLMSIYWLETAANELVDTALALGQIFQLSPSLLGATLLAWGNSVSDLVSNLSMARDGYPTMAITACFASPLFVLLAGLVCTLSYGARSGSLALPDDLGLKVLYGAGVVILSLWAVLVPYVFRYRLTKRAAYLAMGFYMAFQSAYVSAVVKDGSY